MIVSLCDAPKCDGNITMYLCMFTCYLLGTNVQYKVLLGEVYDVPGILDGILRGLEGIPGVIEQLPKFLVMFSRTIKIFQEHLRGFNDPSWWCHRSYGDIIGVMVRHHLQLQTETFQPQKLWTLIGPDQRQGVAVPTGQTAGSDRLSAQPRCCWWTWDNEAELRPLTSVRVNVFYSGSKVTLVVCIPHYLQQRFPHRGVRTLQGTFQRSLR